MDKESPRILLVNPFGIGDVLFTFPLLSELKRLYPRALIGYLCNRRTEALLRAVPLVDTLFVYEKDEFRAAWKRSKWRGAMGYLGLLSALRRRRFDCAFDLSLNREYGVLLWAAGIKKRVGYNFKRRGAFLNYRIDLPRGYADKNVAAYYLDLLKVIAPDSGLTVRSIPKLIVVPGPLKKRAQEALRSFTRDPVIIGIAPAGGRSWGKEAPRKHWKTEHYADLINRLVAIGSISVVLLGSEEERSAAGAVFQGVVRKDKIMNLTGALSLEELMAFLSECRLLVANDGGPLHLAVFLGVPTVSLFGPTDERVYGPYHTEENRGKHAVITKETGCRPCYTAFRMKECTEHYRCLEGITPEEVFAAVKKML